MYIYIHIGIIECVLSYRRKNVLSPYNRYLVAVYECADGYVFVDSTTDRLFCSNGTWLGHRPKCVRDHRKYK